VRLAASGDANGPETRTAEPVVASARPHAVSCKPSPPVVATLVSSGTPGIWHVRLEARAAVAQLEVSMGSRQGDRDLAPVVVWRGSLAQDETREMDVRYAPASEASGVWVDASVVAPGSVQRSRAGLAIQDGRVVPQAASGPMGGRLVVDPASGLQVLEVVGTPGGAR